MLPIAAAFSLFSLAPFFFPLWLSPCSEREENPRLDGEADGSEPGARPEGAGKVFTWKSQRFAFPRDPHSLCQGTSPDNLLLPDPCNAFHQRAGFGKEGTDSVGSMRVVTTLFLVGGGAECT